MTEFKGNLAERENLIAHITKKDRHAFARWVEVAQPYPIPPEALRYLLISPRILELATDPTAVSFHLVKPAKTQGEMIVVDVIEQTPFKPAPEDLDDLQTSYLRHLKVSTLNIQPYKTVLPAQALIQLSLRREGQSLFISNYGDRKKFRGMGVATSYFERARQAATMMGLRFVTSVHYDHKVSFFTDKLGRVPLSQIKPELRGKIRPGYMLSDRTDNFTVDFLYPEDKERFLLPQS